MDSPPLSRAPGNAPPPHGLAVALLVLATGFWGTSFALTKGLSLGQQAIDPAVSTLHLAASQLAVRFLGAVLILGLALGPKLLRATSREWGQATVLAVFSASGMLLQMDGLNYTEASTSAFLTQGYCLLLPMIAAARARRLPGWGVVGGTLLVLAGVAVLAGVRWDNLRLGRGETETLLAALFFTGHIQVLEEPCFAGNDARKVTLLMLGGSVLIYGAVALATQPVGGWTVWTELGHGWGVVGFLVIFPTLCSSLLMNGWQRHVSATEAGLIYSLEPVFATALAFVLPGWLSGWLAIEYANEQFTPRLLVGGALILGANVLVQWRNTTLPRPSGDRAN